MSPVLAFSTWIQRPAAGQYVEHTEAGDLFVLANLFFLFFMIGCIGASAWILWRRSQKPQPHVRLVMDMHHDDEDDRTAPPQPSTPNGKEEAEGDPWEKPADWWKK